MLLELIWPVVVGCVRSRAPLGIIILLRGASIALASMMKATFAVFMHLCGLFFLALQSAFARIVITELGSHSHLW